MDVADLTGAVLADRFEIEELIGEGGYGAIFRAEQLSVGRACAIKILPPDLCDGRTEERFRIEARMTSRLTHPNTVVVYDFGRDEATGVLFLAMELLEGRSVRTAVEEKGAMGVAETASIVAQAAGSLQEAHDEGAIHRDVSPHNLMLVDRGGRGGFAKVIDFGIAKALRTDMALKKSLTQTGMMIGKPAYMAPEQIRSEDVDGRADQYGLAVTAYYMLTGRTPFGKGTAMEIASRQVTESPVAPTAHRSDLAMSEEAESVLMRALEKEPEERFESTEAFGRALEAAADAETVSEEIAPDAETPSEKAEAIDDDRASTLAVPKGDWPGEDDGETLDGEASTETSGESSVDDEPRVARTDAPDQTTVPVSAGDDGGSSERWWAAVGLVALGLGIVGGLSAWILTGGEEAAEATGDRGGGERAGAVDATSTTGSGLAAGEDGFTVPDADAHDGASEEGETTSQESEASAPDVGSADDTSGTGAPETEQQATGDDRSGGSPATVDVRLIPWGTLVIDGRTYEQGSQIEVELEPGSHHLEMQQGGEVVVERDLHLRSGESRSIELVAP